VGEAEKNVRVDGHARTHYVIRVLQVGDTEIMRAKRAQIGPTTHSRSCP